MINNQGENKILKAYPCGFNNITLVTTNATVYFILNGNNLICICSRDFSSCVL
jgi:hypothetical protein